MSQDHDPRPDPAPAPELLAAALVAAHEAIAVVACGGGAEPRIVFVNPAYTELTGYGASEAVGMSPALLAGPGTDRRRVAEARGRLLDGRPAEGELVAYRKDGSEMWIDFRSAPLRDAAGRVTHWVTAHRDVTARRRSLEEAEAALLARTQFLAQISHELLTPLNSLIGFPELLAEGHFGPLNERQLQAIGHVRESGEQLRRLLHDLLDLARIESGRLHLERSRFDLGALLADLAGPAGEAARRKGLALEVEVAPELPPLDGDPQRFKQVVLNLLDNAVKHTPRGGWVRVRAWPAASPAGGPLVRLEVADSGVGIRGEDQERIFRMFEQVDPSLTRRQPGAGLGLALVRRLLELHGGRAWVESAGPGRGSAFQVEAPALCAGAAAAREADSA